MSVSGISNYKDVMYQWQAQQLKATGKSNSSSSSQAASLFGNNTSMIDQISSMIELTKYAMDAMGVGSDARVTFSQITKYRQQLQNEFNQSVKQGLSDSGIANLDSLSFSIDKNGVISAIGSNSQDRAKAQSWLDANPSYGRDLRKKLDDAGSEGVIEFRLSSSGRLTAINTVNTGIQNALDADGDLTANLRAAVAKMEPAPALPIEMVFDESGALIAKGENNTQLNVWLAENPELESAIKKQIEKNGVDASSVSLRLGQSGGIQIAVVNQELSDAQAVLDKSQDLGKKMWAGLDDMGIDSNINFSIQVNADGTINIISDHKDRDKVQAFFDANPDLVKQYRQIETLAGIDDARKAMQISPSEMRKRIQIESMASWWATSDSATSYFGNYNNGQMSLFSGLNLTI